uniref:Uncharacterized protein n=1 Tax=Romanomermis culicivorax TaxID=13658 RepID=A0A915K0I7_ROMCU
MINELTSTACRESNSNVECILFNDRGYVVAYRSAFLAEDGSIGRVYESMHIAHKEPVIAAEILQHKDFVYKSTCNDYSFQSIQRHYVLNTSYKDVVKSSDACRRYQITIVPESNVFLAIVDRSCNRLSTFCPCSVLDRKCLNCLRADPLECECPCECSRISKQGICGDDSEIDPSFYQNCDSIQHQFRHQDPALLSQMIAPLSKCLVVNCFNLKSEGQCLSSIGCEWCTHRDGYRSDPFCASISFCYGGEVSRETAATECCPYRQNQLNASTPIGPVAGGIMAIFVFLVLLVLWYRHKVSHFVESSRSRYGTSSGSGCRLNASDDMDGEFSFDNDKNLDNIQASDCATRNAQAACLLLTSFERENLNAVPVNSRPFWRRGPRTESSDPGYSTMTGGNCDDSEQATVYGDDSVSPRRTDKVEKSLIGWPKNDGRVSKFSDNITERSELITDQEENDEDVQEKSFSSNKTLTENNATMTSNISDSKTGVAEATAYSTPKNDHQTILRQDSGHILTTKAIVHAVDIQIQICHFSGFRSDIMVEADATTSVALHCCQISM